MTRKSIVDYFPVISSFLIEYGNAGQLWKMWTQHTAAGQNLWSWLSIMIALLLWTQYHRVKVGKNAAYFVTWIGVFMMVAIMASIVHFSGL